MWILLLLIPLSAYAIAITFVNNYRYEAHIDKLQAATAFRQQEQQERKVLKRKGYDIHYFTSGEKENELLIFLPAAFCDHSTFEHQVAYFSKDYRVITIDLLGHGLTQAKDSEEGIEASAEHLLQIMELEGYEKAHLAGVSMGTLIAQHFAFLYPEKVSSVAVTGGYNIHKDNSEIAAAQSAEKMKWFFKVILSMDSFRRYVASTSVIKPEEQAKIYMSTKAYTRRSFSVMPGLNKLNYISKSPERKYPLLLMVGDQDVAVSVEYSQNWHKEDPDTQFVIIKNAGHNANMDNPEDYNRILKNFIEKKL